MQKLAEFRILRRLGEGGMGAVYLGYDGKHDRHIAIKVLNQGLATSQSYLDRFGREARAGAQLNHPNIVRTFGAGQDASSGKHYLVLEYVDGPSAQALLQRQGQLLVGDAVHIALHMARALEHAHSRNIIHRDIKPDNILITRSGVSKLGDLGLAKRLDEASSLTAVRTGFGTTAYMPYEQAINAKHADGRSDIYALGATLYHLITGQVPFPGESHLDVVDKKANGYYRPASSLNSSVPSSLDLILGKMLARQQRDRYQTASELIIDLERSRLAVSVPSFADPELARNDPWLQACQSTGEPTRLDPDSSVVARKQEWVVRYRNRAGRSFTSRLSTEEIIERLDEGLLPGDTVLHPAGEDDFRPVFDYEQFRPHLPTEDEAPVLEVEPKKPLKWMVPLLAIGAVVTALLVGLGRLLWFRS